MIRRPNTNTHGRNGLRQCRGCRKQFTVAAGTILEGSRIPLHKWLRAVQLMCSSQGLSVVQVQREVELGSYRSAWFMCRRIRWAMTQPPLQAALLARIDGTLQLRSKNHSLSALSLLARQLLIALPPTEAIRLLLTVKPLSDMPRPGTHRQTSIMAQINEEYGPVEPTRKWTSKEK